MREMDGNSRGSEEGSARKGVRKMKRDRRKRKSEGRKETEERWRRWKIKREGTGKREKSMEKYTEPRRRKEQ